MRNEKIWNVVQRIFIFALVTILSVSVIYTQGDLSRAMSSGKKNEVCAIQSVTVQMGAEETKLDGGLEPVVTNDVSWSLFFETLEILDVEVINNHCTQDCHRVQSYVDMNGEWVPMKLYWVEDKEALTDSIEDYTVFDEDAAFYDVKFEFKEKVDKETPTGIYVRFVKPVVTPCITTMPTVAAITEGQSLSDATLTGGKVIHSTTNDKEVKGTFKWKDKTIVPAKADSGLTTYTMVFTPEDTDRYTVVETEVTVTVNEVTYKAPEAESAEVTQSSETEATQSSEVEATQSSEVEVTQSSETETTQSLEAEATQSSEAEAIPSSQDVSVQTVTQSSAPQPGDTIEVDNATYEITVVKDSNVEAAYIASAGQTKKVTIPKTIKLSDGTVAKVTSIADNAFKGNTTLKQITIGANVNTIGENAFNGCKNLKKVKGAKNVVTIEARAFAGCSRLTSVSMTSTLKTIGEKAFYNCSALKKITIKTSLLAKNRVGKDAFKGIHSKATITVPKKKLKSYKTLLKDKGVGADVEIKK